MRIYSTDVPNWKYDASRWTYLRKYSAHDMNTCYFIWNEVMYKLREQYNRTALYYFKSLYEATVTAVIASFISINYYC